MAGGGSAPPGGHYGSAGSSVTSVNGQTGSVGDPIYTNGILQGTTQLASLPAASLSSGAQAFTDNGMQAVFQLVQPAIAPTVDNLTWVAASGKPGFYWQRLPIPNLQFASMPAWHVDPINGNDENIGTAAGAGNALATNAEWSRRTQGLTLAVTTTLNWDNDIPDADALVIGCNAPPTSSTGVQVVGSQTVVSTQTVNSAQARTPASNLANEIQTTADLSAFVNQLIRVQGTQNYASIVKAVSAGDARCSELWNTSTSTQAAAAGIIAGQIVEVVQTRKGPLRVIVTGRCTPSFTDVRLDGTGSVIYCNMGATTNGGSTFVRVIFGGTTSSTVNAPFGILMVGGLCKGGAHTVLFAPNLYQGTAFTCPSLSVQTPYFKSRSLFLQACTLVLGPATCHLDGDIGQFDLGAGVIGISVNASGTGEASSVSFQSGRHYGGGNSATAWVWSVGFGSWVRMLAGSPPTMNAGNGVAINGGNTAIGSLPVALSTTTGSAVYSA